jgi:hypothetical protein
MANKLSKPLFLHIIHYFINIFTLLLVIRPKVVGPYLETCASGSYVHQAALFLLVIGHGHIAHEMLVTLCVLVCYSACN